jgi:hypothetical protein
MSKARHLGYWKIKTWRRGSPSLNHETGKVRQTKGVVYEKNAVASLAYRGCCKLHDQASGKTHNYSSKDHLFASVFATPPECGWSRDREVFANTIERTEKRCDARLAREIQLICPHDMNPQVFLNQITAYVNFLSSRYKTTVVADIHDPHKNDHERWKTGRNLHAHITFPTRETLPDGFGKKIKILDDINRSRKEIDDLRKEWSRSLEVGFKWQGENVQFDARSYKKRGINRIPQPKLGCGAAMHKRGLHSYRMDLFEATEEQNRELETFEQTIKPIEKKITTLKKLASTNLVKIGCARKEDYWDGSAWRQHHHLDIDATMNFVEDLAQRSEIVSSLLEDMTRLKRRCNDDLDFQPTIQEVPPDLTFEDLYPLISQALSEYGISPGSRHRSRSPSLTAGMSRSLER